MTPDTPDSPTGNAGRGPESATPKLADRLSALVGQAAVRQDESVSAERLVAAISARVDSAAGELRERIAVVETSQATRMQALESLVAERLAAIEAALGSLRSDDDTDLKSHVDGVGGALVMRLDEVLAGLAEQVDQTRNQVVGQLEETKTALTAQAGTARASAEGLEASLDEVRHQLAGQLEEARSQLADQAEVSRTSLTAVVESVDATVRGHVGDLAAGVLELGGGQSLTREDIDAALSDLHADVRDLPSLFETVAQAAQLDGVTATTTALRDELDGVVQSLAVMRSEFAGLQDAIELRVDDAALALAETLVAVITSLPSSSPAPVSYDLDDLTALEAQPAEGGLDGDWAAADEPEDLAETLTSTQLDDAAVLEESEEQAAGIDEGGIDESAVDEGASDTFQGAFAQPHADDASPARRKGIFRR